MNITLVTATEATVTIEFPEHLNFDWDVLAEYSQAYGVEFVGWDR